MSAEAAIRAAGVVLLREGDNGLEFVVVHRPGRQDWSLPKGKVEEGEHVLTAALRECDEETGYWPLLQAPLPLQSYSVGSRPKIVHYWRSRVREENGFAPDEEVDEVLWLPVTQAAEHLTYPSEVDLVQRAAGLPDTSPLILLRHTQALKRAQFDGKVDAERPLSGKGRSQAKALMPVLDAFGIGEVHSSTARRCHQTVAKFAKSLDVGVHHEPTLTEEAHREDPEAAHARIAALALDPAPLVVCSHRPVWATAVSAAARALGVEPTHERWRAPLDPRLAPGGFIVFHRAIGADGEVSVIDIERHSIGTP
ncbi:MAG TPA: NUDIX hydrolase [Actinobacteria bacterium]|jgi:8-oxo-dGTP diphosphatase|nr:NUDIX hydrolase [Actinomycetota bacterium]